MKIFFNSARISGKPTVIEQPPKNFKGENRKIKNDL
jgi:hypothetical protein